MGSVPFIGDFVLVLGAALVAGFMVSRLKQLPMLGYLIAGALIGPSALGLVEDPEQVNLLAEIGIAFIMFALGAQLSMLRIHSMYKLAVLASALQICVTILVAAVVGLFFHMPLAFSVLTGILVAVSSTVVIVKLLTERGEIDTEHGRITLALTIGQDALLVPLIIFMPYLGEVSSKTLFSVGRELALGMFLTIATYLVGVRVLPGLLARIASAGRELFLLAAIFIALGLAVAMKSLGLPAALGAFLAGVIVGQSIYNQLALIEVVPFRDVFSVFFFVAAGMLLDVPFVLNHPTEVMSIVLVIIAGKVLICSLVCIALGYRVRSSVMVGLYLANLGEDSFLLLQVGTGSSLLGPDGYSLIVASALVSIFLSPLITNAQRVMAIARWFAPVLGRSFEIHFQGSGAKKPEAIENMLTDHVVICGYGMVGRAIAGALESRGIPYTVVDRDPAVVAELRLRRVPVVYGDAANPEVLSQARLYRASDLFVAISDDSLVKAIVGAARRSNPDVRIIARHHGGKEAAELLNEGANEVVQSDVELSQAFLRRFWKAMAARQAAAPIRAGTPAPPPRPAPAVRRAPAPPPATVQPAEAAAGN